MSNFLLAMLRNKNDTQIAFSILYVLINFQPIPMMEGENVLNLKISKQRFQVAKRAFLFFALELKEGG
jgi:hypothetical protein